MDDRSFRNDADKVERYIYDFRDISKVLVEDCRLNDYDRLRLFLNGLPDDLAKAIYSLLKLKAKQPKTFAQEGGFKKAFDAALTHNRETEDFRLMQGPGKEAETKRTTPLAPAGP